MKRIFRPKSNEEISKAKLNELLVDQDGSPVMGIIDDEAANALGLPPGVIYSRVGAITHIEDKHGKELMSAGYSDIVDFVANITNNYESIYEGKDNSLLLSKPLSRNNAIAAIEFIPDEVGVYQLKTSLIVRSRSLKNKKLLFERSEPARTNPAVDEDLRKRPFGIQEGLSPNADLKSNVRPKE